MRKDTLMALLQDLPDNIEDVLVPGYERGADPIDGLKIVTVTPEPDPGHWQGRFTYDSCGRRVALIFGAHGDGH